jgi:methylmalonyl-CoA mutase N-terminal domain/subunit
MENEAETLFEEIRRVGGVVAGIEAGWFQRQIAQSALRFQHEVEQQRRTIVGVNDFLVERDHPVEILKVSDQADVTQRKRLRTLRQRRDQAAVERALADLTGAAECQENVIPAMLDCARAYCTLFEIRHALERVYGAYREPVFF